MTTDAPATVGEVLGEEMAYIDVAIERLDAEIEKLNNSVLEKRQRKAELEGERRALDRILQRLLESAGGSGLGPTEAIARVVEENNGQLTRSEVFDRAVVLVKTPSPRPRKVIDSTYRNLIGKRYDERNGRVFLISANGNGHAP